MPCSRRAEVEVSVEHGGAEEIPKEVSAPRHARSFSNRVVAEMHVASQPLLPFLHSSPILHLFPCSPSRHCPYSFPCLIFYLQPLAAIISKRRGVSRILRATSIVAIFPRVISFIIQPTYCSSKADHFCFIGLFY